MFVYNIILFGLAISPAVSSAVRNLASISTCRASEFTCLDGTCIRAGAVCDTYWDCPDGSDEASCYSSTNSNLSEATESHERYRRQTSCGFDQWRCTDGTCIAIDGKCDGKVDCPNRSDEAHALCRNIKSTVSGKCVLPPYPEHGSYVAINAPYATPGQSLQYAQLNVICEQGYGLVSDTMPYCLDGTWFISIQKCVPFCRLYPDVSVHYYCQFPGTNGYRICNQSLPLGTFVRPECNAPIYGSRNAPLSMTCQNDGKWNRIIRCDPECGRVTPAAEGLISGGTEAVRGELPWHVGIYQKPTQKRKYYYEQICGGSLVSNWIVISAAHCFWDTVKQEKRATSNYAVATAKLFREWDHKDDKDAQKFELRSIEIPPRYLGVRLNFDHDIAVLILDTPVVYYTYVRPVCLDLFDPKFNNLQLQAGNFGKVAGWGLTGENGPASPVLKAVQLPFVPFQECIRNTPETFTESITWDKICAGYNNGTAAVCKGDSGGGLSFPEIERGANRYYLRGVASTAPRGSQQCNVATVTTFTEIFQHKKFINQFLGQFRCKDGSAIPASDLCDGNPDCPDGSDEEISACAVRICPSHLFQCADGACVDQGSACNGINECADGSDESDEVCKRQLPSNPTVTDRLIQSGNCFLPPPPKHGTYVVAPNATPGQGFPSLALNIICQPGYRMVSSKWNEILGNGIIVFCLEGRWSNSIPKCVHETVPDDVRDPCVPSPCGPNSECRDVGNIPSCSCLTSFIGSPPNCRPECTLNMDCPSDRLCIISKCLDPCPGSCGISTVCSVPNHVPVCTCIDGYVGDPYISCTPKPLEDETKPDDVRNPCVPSPCGPNSECRDVGNTPSCSCLTSFIGSPPNCRPECTLNLDCPSDRACINSKCLDPCPGSCGISSVCSVPNHVPICTCTDGYVGDPYISCTPKPLEGAACEWNGLKGKCVKETQCMTTLDTRGDKQHVCTTTGDVPRVCCTDCELVNDTRNVVMDPKGGFYWKDGTKARDSCLQYLKDLPYNCREGQRYDSGIEKRYDKEKKCHTIGTWVIGGTPLAGSKPGAEYPHQAMLGYGVDLASAKWKAGGSIVSNKFILTAAHVVNLATQNGELKFVALGVERRSDPTAWQTHKVKRFIPHPDYKTSSKYNDIALIELETPITFNKNVLPACLHVEAANAETAIATTWSDLKKKSSYDIADVIQTINLDVFTEEECKTWHVNYNTQMCYGSKSHSPDACKGQSGEPLLITTQFSRCIYTVIGVTSFGTSYCGPNHTIPDVYTRVAHYKPWIESVVWA